MRASGEEALSLYQYQPSVGLEKLKGCPVLDESSARLAGLRTIWVVILLQFSRLLPADPVADPQNFVSCGVVSIELNLPTGSHSQSGLACLPIPHCDV